MRVVPEEFEQPQEWARLEPSSYNIIGCAMYWGAEFREHDSETIRITFINMFHAVDFFKHVQHWDIAIVSEAFEFTEPVTIAVRVGGWNS